MDINTCIALDPDFSISYYSHLVPTFIGLFLAGYALFNSKYSKLSILFSAFVFSFSLWLVGDLVDWVSPNYYLVYFTWSWLDFVNVVFFVLGGYFFGVLCRASISNIEKILLALVCVPAFLITITGNSVLEFTQPFCEAVNSDLLTYYKLAAEALIVLWMFVSFVSVWKKSDVRKRVQLGVVLGAIVLFFSVFAGTEYIASITGVYEINLYGLFVLPLFLIILTFAITDLRLFQFRFLGTQILAYVLVIIVGSQLLYVRDSTDRNLSLVTLAISLFIAVLLIENARREAEARLKIEELAHELDTANKQQTVLIRFITHQIKGFLTKSRNIFAMMKEGDVGKMPEESTQWIDEGFNSDTKGVNTIQEILNASNIKSGKVSYTMAPFDIKALIEEIVGDLKAAADKKSIALNLHLPESPLMYTGDRVQLINALKNLIDNSIKYTPSGSIDITLRQEAGKIVFETTDTGVGITQEDMQNLFTEGGHGKDSQKVNVESTGFGLYIVKNIVEGHKGTVSAESEGAGKGSHFIVELPIIA